MKTVSTLASLLDRDSLQSTVPAGSTILVGLSGGADSVALLQALVAVYEPLDLKIAAVHVNHGLRASAGSDEAMVKDLCGQLNVPLSVRRLSPTKKPPQVSPEQHWRQLRYKAFAEVLGEVRADFVALGHNADDLAETFLFHLARGTGVNGLIFSFYSTNSSLPVIRPFWHTKRSEIETALQDIGQDWVTDPTNADTRFSRNHIRHKVLPALKEINPAAVDAIVSLSMHLRDMKDHTPSENANQALAGNGEVAVFPLQLLRTLPILAHELRDFVTSKSKVLMDSRQVDQALHIIHSRKSGTVALRGKSTLVITQEYAWIHPADQPADKDLAKGHEAQFGGLIAHIPIPLFTSDSEKPAIIPTLNGLEWTVTVNGPEALQLRNRQDGDRVGSKPLTKIFIEHKMPWYLRDFLVLLTDTDGTIVGVAGWPLITAWIERHNKVQVSVTYTKSQDSA